MKNQIDQSTPFLAFYDLLRIRGIYSDEEKREKLRRGFRRAMALAAVLVGLALPNSARALPGGLAGDSRVSVSGTTMTIHPNAGADAGSGFSWDSFNVANGETVTIDATSIHTAPSFDVAGLVDAGSNVLVFRTPGGNIAVSGTIRAGRFYAATFGAFDYENMSFKASDVAGGEIDISGTIPSGSILVGHTIAASGAAGTVVGTSGMDDASEITIASGGGTITFKGTMGAASLLKAGTIAFEDNAEANGTVDAGDAGTISGDFTQSGGSVKANEIAGTLTQSGGEATANRIQSLAQNNAAAVANTATITGVANQTAGTINTGAATTLSVGAGSTLGAGSVTAGTVSVGSGSGALTLAGNELSGKTINAGAVTLAGAADQVYNVSGAISSVATGDNVAGAVTVSKTGTGGLSLGSINAASLSASTVGGNITQTGATTLSGTGEKNVTLDAGTGTINLSQGVSGAGTLTLLSNASAAGVITAAKIDATGKTFTQNGAGTITVSGADGIVASQVSQTYNGTEGARSTIRADKIEADFVQTGAYAAVDAFTENGTLDIKGNVSQNADNGVIGSSSTNVKLGDMGKPLDQDKGTIDAKELWICENSTSAGDILAETITLQRRNGTWLELEQDGPGTITATGSGITASRIIQSSNGKIKTDRINDINNESGLPAEGGIGGRVEQTGAATLQANNPENGLKIGGYLWQKHQDAVVGTDDEDVEIFGVGSSAVLDQDAGTVKAKTLTLHGDSTSGGTINAERIVARADDGTLKTLTQDGAGTIKAASGELELDAVIVQNAAGATIGSTDTSVKVDQAFTQTAGKIEANTLALVKAGEAYALGGANNVKILTSKDSSPGVVVDTPAQLTSVTINNGQNALELKDVSTANGLTVTSAGAVTDSGTGVAGGTLTVTASTGVTLDDTAALNVAGIASSGKVSISAGTSLTQSGDIKSTGGDVGITTASFTQGGNAISGQNVTILDGGSDGLTVNGNVTANAGDILVKSAEGDVKTTNAATLESKTGSIVLQGANVEVDGSTVSAKTANKGVGIQATAGDATVKTGTAITAPTVVLDASGNAVVETGVSMGKAAAADKDADLFVAAGGNVDVKLSDAGKPTDSVTIVSGSLAEVPNEETTVELASFGYKTDGDIGFKFAGSKLAVESTGGNVSITAVKRDGETADNVHGLTIVDMSKSVGGASVSAKNVVDADDDPVEIKVGSDTASVQPKGLVAAAEGKSVTLDASAIGDVTVEGVITSANAPTITMADGKSFTVANHGIVQSLDEGVSVATTGAGAIDVKSGGTVQAANGAVTLTTEGGAIAVAGTVQAAGGAVEIESGDALTVSGTVRDSMTTFVDEQELSISAGGGIKLSTTGTGDAAKDVTVSGTAEALGAVEIVSAKDVVLSGTVSSGDDNPEAEADGSVAITAAQGIRQTGGLVASRGEGGTLEFTATDGNINQTGGAVTATGAATAKAENGSVVLSQAGNDFQSTLAVTAKNAASVRDANALEVSISGDTTGNVRIQAGTTLGVTSDIDAGGTATLLSGEHMDAQAVKAAGAVQATAASGGATFAGDIEGASVAATATGGALETKAVTANNGNTALSGASVTTGGDVTASGANSDATISATGGAAQMGGAVTAGRDATITATGGAATTGGTVTAGRDASISGTAGATTTAGEVTAGRNATIDAGNGAARVAAVTAASGDATISGASVNASGALQARRGTVALSATAGSATVGGAVDARNITVDATTGVALNGATTATGSTAVFTENGAIAINANASAPTAVYRAEKGNVTIAEGATVSGTRLGIRGNAIVNNGSIKGVNTLALVTGGAATYDDASIPAKVTNLGLQSDGNLTVTVSGDLTANGANVSTEPGNKNRTVEAAGIVSSGGTVEVIAGGDIAAANITGAEGTTVTAQKGGAINVAGDIGDGGPTTVNANGANVTAGTLVSGGALTVNDAGDVEADIQAGDDATIHAGSLTAEETTTGGALVLDVGGDAALGTVDIDGDVNGNVDGLLTITDGTVGSIGQEGDSLTTDEFQLDGDLASGAVTMDAGTFQMDGNLDAGNAAVDITANGGIQGGGVLTSGPLSLQGGAIGAAGAAFQVNTATLQNIAGTGIYLVDTAGGQIAINVVNATGDLDLSIPNATVAGGGNVSAGGNMTLAANDRFGDLGNPVNVTVGGTLTINGVGVPMLHIVINGDADPGDITIVYNADGFAIWGNDAKGYQIVGAGPSKERLINRALTFTVNTPELKSKQGIFGDPAFVHTRMNVSEARSVANMDMLALNAVDFYDTWEHIQSGEGRRALRKWAPKVDMGPNSLLMAKLGAQASEMETQPEVWVPGQTGASSPAPAAPAAE